MNTDRVELMIAFLDRLIALRNGPDKYFCTYEIEQVIDEIAKELRVYDGEDEEAA